jgi:hypothetical protein
VAEPRHLRHHLDGARGSADRRREPAPQLHRPRRVSDLRRDRAALHPHARRPLPRAGRDDRLPHPGLERGDHARRALAEVEVEAAPGKGGAAGREAEPRLRRRRPRGLGKVLPLLRRRTADRPPARGQVRDRARGRRAPRRREHDRRRRRPRHHLHRPCRRHPGDQRPAAADPGHPGARRAAARRRRLGRLRLALPLPALRVGLPARAGALDQRLRAQVRPRLPGDRLARLPREVRPGRGPRLLRELPRQNRRHLHPQLLHRRLDGAGAVLQLGPLPCITNARLLPSSPSSSVA